MNVKENAASLIREAKMGLNSLTVYRKLLEDDVIKAFYSLLDSTGKVNFDLAGFLNKYGEFFNLIISTEEFALRNYLEDRIIFDENAFTKISSKAEVSTVVKYAAGEDLHKLRIVSNVTSRLIKEYVINSLIEGTYEEFEIQIIENLPDWENELYVQINSRETDYVKAVKRELISSGDWKDSIEVLMDFHRRHGSGLIARYPALTWESEGSKGAIKGISSRDPISLSQLIGYNAERQVVIENTQQFLKGYSANNVLLYGDRGTGKSSTIKAILNEFCAEGLRMVEMPKASLFDFPKLINYIKGREQKFIIFIDDLVFGDDEEVYTSLKSVLEGSLESKPDNVLIYATSNRRHLIKEYFQDRTSVNLNRKEGEINSYDTIQEKLSLADRFGISVTFTSPDQKKYLEIVDGLAKERKISIDKEKLHMEALKWEKWYNGRSARSARQFIDWVEGHQEEMCS